MDMKRSLMTGAALLAMCAGGAAEAADASFAMPYHLPKTTPVVAVAASLVSCGATPTIRMELTLSARADTGPGYALVGESLSSWRVKRDVTITVDDSGRLKTLNATGEDQIGSIIGSIVKFAVSLAARGGPPAMLPPPAIKCSAAAQTAVSRAEAIRAQLVTLRQVTLTAGKDVPDPGTRLATIDALAAELATLETGPLRKTFSADVDLPAAYVAGAALQPSWPAAPLAAWFEPGSGADALIDSQLQAVTLVATPLPTTQVGASAKPTNCKLALPTPQPMRVRFDLTQGGAVTGSVQAPVQQWGQVANLCLDVGFFATRDLQVAWDSFGAMTSFKWASNARGAAAAESLAATAEAIGKYRQEHEPDTATENAIARADLADARIRALKSQQCLAVLEAGGQCAD